MKITVKNQHGEIILDDGDSYTKLGQYENETKNIFALVELACTKLKEITGEKANYEIH